MYLGIFKICCGLSFLEIMFGNRPFAPKFHQLPGLLALQQKGRSVPQVLSRVRQPCANMSNLDGKITRFFEIPFTAEDLLEDLQVAFIFLFFGAPSLVATLNFRILPNSIILNGCPGFLIDGWPDSSAQKP